MWYRGNIQFYENGTIIYTIYNASGSELGSITAVDSTYDSGGIGFRDYSDAGSIFDNVTVKTAQAGVANLPAEYQNEHSVTNSVGGFVNISSTNNVSFYLNWLGDANGDGTYETALGTSTVLTSAGNYSFSWSEFTGDNVRVTINVSSTGPDEAFVLEKEGVKANTHPPAINNNSASPTGPLSTVSPTFQIDINDTDFQTAQGDSVDVEFYTNRSGLVGTDTLTANGTVSVSSTAVGGTTEWWAVARDSYGNSQVSANFTFTAPSELRILNESAPTQLVDNTTVELRFYTGELTNSPQVFTKTTTNGAIDMTGLPVGEPFVVVAKADGYYDRRIFVPSLSETQQVYLLPDSVTSADTIFELKDYSGAFPQDVTVLLVQRAINGTYETVLGDYFGATSQFPAILELGARYRLVLMNVETGQTKTLGTYTPLTAATQTVTVSPSGTVVVQEIGVTINVDPATRRLPALNGTEIGVTVEEGSGSVANWSATATLVNGSTSTVIWTHGATGADSVTQALNLTGHAGEQLVVNVSVTDSNGLTETDSARFAIDPVFDTDQTLIAVAGRLVDLSPPEHRSDFTMFLAIAISIFLTGGLATQLRVSGETSAFVGVLAIAGFAVIGWAPMSLVFVTAVGFVSFAGLRRGL